MIIHTVKRFKKKNYLLFMFFSLMIGYIKFRLALAISFQGNFHMRVKQVLYELNSSDIIRSETLS